MRLTSVQVARIRELDTHFHSQTASRGALIHEATEDLVEGILEVIKGVGPGPSAIIPCGAVIRGKQCPAKSDFLYADGRARCLAHRNTP